MQKNNTFVEPYLPNNKIGIMHLAAGIWQGDQLLIVQKFFDAKVWDLKENLSIYFLFLQVVAPPYRPTFLSGFCRLLNCPTEVLKNIIQLMRYELQPELVTQNKLKSS